MTTTKKPPVQNGKTGAPKKTDLKTVKANAEKNAMAVLEKIDTLNKAKGHRDTYDSTREQFVKISNEPELSNYRLTIYGPNNNHHHNPIFETRNPDVFKVFLKDGIEFCQQKIDEYDILIETELRELAA